MRARWLDPSLGTWTTTDPSYYEDFYNLYEILGLDYINNSDPSGKIIVVASKRKTYTDDDVGLSIVCILKNIFGSNAFRLNYGKESATGRTIITGDEAGLMAHSVFGRAVGEWLMPGIELEIVYVENGDLHKYEGALTPEANEFGNKAVIKIDPIEGYKGMVANVAKTPETTFLHELAHALTWKHPEIIDRARRYEYGKLNVVSDSSQNLLEGFNKYSKVTKYKEQFPVFFENLYRSWKGMTLRSGYMKAGQYEEPKPPFGDDYWQQIILQNPFYDYLWGY